MSEHSHLRYGDIDPVALDTELGMERYGGGGDLDPKLIQLVKVRAAELNGCSYCRAMHSAHARGLGEQQGRLDHITNWASTPSLYSAREQAALTFTESLSAHGSGTVPEDVWREAALAFEEREIVDLLILVSSINGWSALRSSTTTPTDNSSLDTCEAAS